MQANTAVLPWRGVNYNTGTDYAGLGPGAAGPHWSRPLYREHMAAIRNELHCTSVNLYGTDIAGLTECAAAAAEAGLHVWLQPRLVEGTAEATLAYLAEAAGAAEKLRLRYGAIDLNVGCELTVFGSGIIPGRTHGDRAAKLPDPEWWTKLPQFNSQLNELLGHAQEVARTHFNGRISYAAGLWEDVDWTGFDFVGVNYYRMAYNSAEYVTGLRTYLRPGKPVLITEFGCCTFTGAGDMGPGGYGIIDWSARPPALNDAYTRDEREQADYLAQQLDIFAAEGVHGAYVFEFIAPKPYSPDPRHDLDMGSFGLAKVDQDGGWVPKLSFHEVARRYGTP
ncbi:abortive infection protein [Streptomyces sp. NPDC091289]|uniref:abortive infection protein n=1 Tax=Streptomyces sp. NPDC091289 TaxID=3365989 RepID=UPI003815C35E